MDDALEKGQTRPHETSSQIETPDGEGVYLFRYDNPAIPSNNPDTSQEALVGTWFTDSLKWLRTYILMRPPGGSIIIAQVSKDKLEELRASNHPMAQSMDIEYDNFILTVDLLQNSKTIPLAVLPSTPKKFMLADSPRIGKAIDEIVAELRK
jgi:hypothetical protein